MAEIYSRRDIGFTIISRFEETYRQFLVDALTNKYKDFKEGIPEAIVLKVNERANNDVWDDAVDFFENIDFPDLLDISISKSNFKEIFPEPVVKETLVSYMTNLYALRCKIAHVKGFFTSIELDKLVELCKLVGTLIDKQKDFLNLIRVIEQNPEKVAVKVPVSFTIDYLESNGIVNNLPIPDYEYEGGFVGREDDIKDIIKLIQRGKFPVVTITGAGGVGKTSLALKVIQELTQKPQPEKYDAIVWLSAKENKLSPFGIEDIEPTFKSYEDLLDTIINVLGFGVDIAKDSSLESKENAVEILLEIVDSVLIIVDNLETISDERIINFIIDAPEKVKFLITSRKGLGQVERRYELKQLKEKEAVYLFRQLAKDKQIPSLLRIDDELIKKYVNKVSNYPLAIKWVIGQVARGRDINKITDSIDDASGDISKFCFEQIFSMLDNNSKHILYALCCFEEPPTSALLRYVVETNNQEFDDSIEELILTSLIIPEQFKNEQDEIASKYYILPLTKGYVRQQLNANTHLRDKIFYRLQEVENTTNASKQAKRAYSFNIHNLGATTEEEKIASIFSQTAFQKYQAGLYDDAVDNYKKAIAVAPRFSSIYRNWALMESQENHLSEADHLMQKASDLNPSDSQIWFIWGNIKRKAGKVSEADSKYKEAHRMSPENYMILNAYGQTRSRLGDYEYALKLFHEAIAVESSNGSKKHELINRTSIAEALIGLSEFLFSDRKKSEAEEKLFEALNECEKILEIDDTDGKGLGVLAKTYYKIGKHYNRMNDFVQAKVYFNHCIELVSVSIKCARYKMKSAIEISKIYFEENDIASVRRVLHPTLVGNDAVFKAYPEILNEINHILEKTGGTSSLVNGKIYHVDIIKEYVLIETLDAPRETYLAGKLDFYPVLNSISDILNGKNVRFIPKVKRNRDREKLVAKNIVIND